MGHRDAIPDDDRPTRVDAAWIQRMLEGDESARRWVETRLTCVPRMARWLNDRMGRPLPPMDVQDVVQDALLVVWRKLPEFEARASIETWAYRIVRFEILNAVRRRQRRGRSQRDEDDSPLDQVAAPVNEPLDADERVRLLACLERLDEEKRVVIDLKHFEQLAFREIGERLGVPENTARTRYYRGLQRLRDMLEPAGVDRARRVRPAGIAPRPREAVTREARRDMEGGASR